MAFPLGGAGRVRGNAGADSDDRFSRIVAAVRGNQRRLDLVGRPDHSVRVPFITERVMPFAVLVGAMFCYLNLSRRLELVVARAAGISAWQFVAPALVIAVLLGLGLTVGHNPILANWRGDSTTSEAGLSG